MPRPPSRRNSRHSELVSGFLWVLPLPNTSISFSFQDHLSPRDTYISASMDLGLMKMAMG